MKTALFGGSFNPVHNGHVHLVKSVMKQNKFDRCIVIPAYVSPFKTENISYVDPMARYEMCKLAFEGMKGVTVSDYEITKRDVSYTSQTLEYFSKKYYDDKLYFIVGSDSLDTLMTWHEFEKIMKLCTIVAAVRDNDDKDKLYENARKIKKYGEVILTDIEPFEVSSTEIRNKILLGESVNELVPENVLLYIKKNNLYR